MNLALAVDGLILVRLLIAKLRNARRWLRRLQWELQPTGAVS